MALFDILDGRINKYETNHIHIIMDGDIEYPCVNMDNKNYGIFFHEYIHYLQHLTTLFGVKLCSIYNKLFVSYNKYVAEHETITLPLHCWKEDETLSTFINKFKAISGSSSCVYNIDEVEIADNEILNAKKSRQAVKVGIYDFKNEQAEEDGFRFGYLCVIESMAHLIQSFIDEEIDHNDVPYCAAELVFRSKYSEKSDDKKLLISLCFCSLMYDNPGTAFFEMIDFSKENPSLNGYELYKVMMKTRKIVLKSGEKLSLADALIRFLEDLQSSIEAACGCKLEYYGEVFDHCKQEISNGDCVLLDVLYNGDISDKQFFTEVFEKVYGYPFVEAHNMALLPMKYNEETKCNMPYEETARLLGLELIFKRLTSTEKQTECTWYRNCKKMLYCEGDVTSQECLCNQWDKTEDCLMTESLRYYNLDNKSFIQK